MKSFFQSILGLSLIFLLVFPHSINAEEADKALYDYLNGKSFPKSRVQKFLWKHSFDCWNKPAKCGKKGLGSQNLPVLAHASIGDYKWIADLCRHELKEGLFGRELGSPAYYFTMVVAAKMVALRDARRVNAEEDVKAIEENLRAVWAYESLTALPTNRKSYWANLSGHFHTGTGDAKSYDGLTNAVAGERWKSTRYLSHDNHGEFLAWALDWRPRRDEGRNLIKKDGWWKHFVAQVGGVTFYNDTVQAFHFGLSENDRRRLTGVIHGNRSDVEWAFNLVKKYGIWQAYRVRIRRTSMGSELVFFHSNNGNKPAHAATSITNEGRWKTIRPSRRSKNSNVGYRVWIDNGVIFADAKTGNKVSMPELGGQVYWQVDLNGQSATLTLDGDTSVPSQPGPPVQDPSPVDPESPVEDPSSEPVLPIGDASEKLASLAFQMILFRGAGKEGERVWGEHIRNRGSSWEGFEFAADMISKSEERKNTILNAQSNKYQTHLNQLHRIYQTLLLRCADPVGQSIYLPFVQQNNFKQLVSALLSSPEFKSKEEKVLKHQYNYKDCK